MLNFTGFNRDASFLNSLVIPRTDGSLIYLIIQNSYIILYFFGVNKGEMEEKVILHFSMLGVGYNKWIKSDGNKRGGSFKFWWFSEN